MFIEEAWRLGGNRRLPGPEHEGAEAAELRGHSAKEKKLANEGLAQALLHSGRWHPLLRQVKGRRKTLFH